MTGIRAYRALAQAFASEGVDRLFVLMGDGNMHFAQAMAEINGVETFQTRHEHCACAAAIACSLATGQIGAATVTCGPGLAQITTALATAAQARVPLVVFAGEVPLHGRWHNQEIAQPPLAVAAGARYIAAHSLQRMLDQVREAFYLARAESGPVVLGIPYDLQQELLPEDRPYMPSSAILPPPGRPLPRPELLDVIVEKISAADRPIIVVGRGIVSTHAEDEIAALADQCGALLATTLPARGLYDGNPFSIGIAGGFGSEFSHRLFLDADLIIAVGTSLSHHTSDGGRLFGNAFVVHIDPNPIGLHHGLAVADLHVRGDARESAVALLTILRDRGISRKGYRSAGLARQIAEETNRSSGEIAEPGTFDPNVVIRELDRIIPRDWDIVSGGGHSSYFTAQMHGRSPRRFHTIREFGAIGNGLSYALGVAASSRERKVVLIEGDGGLMMHIQELETIRRHGLKLLICVLNDGAYGSEVHKLRHDGLDPRGSIFGREDFASVANGFRLGGSNVGDLAELPALLEKYQAHDLTEIWNFPISENIMSPPMRRAHTK